MFESVAIYAQKIAQYNQDVTLCIYVTINVNLRLKNGPKNTYGCDVLQKMQEHKQLISLSN